MLPRPSALRRFHRPLLGDGVLIYFGWPEAHKANAERAVRAALAVIDAIAQAPVLTEPLQVCIGIATNLPDLKEAKALLEELTSSFDSAAISDFPHHSEGKDTYPSGELSPEQRRLRTGTWRRT